MPTSKKRVKKNYDEIVPVTKNPLKSVWGKAVIIVLALGFVLGSVVLLIFTMIEAFNT